MNRSKVNGMKGVRMSEREMKMIKCDEVAERLGISRTSAYAVIKELNQELSAKGDLYCFFGHNYS